MIDYRKSKKKKKILHLVNECIKKLNNEIIHKFVSAISMTIFNHFFFLRKLVFKKLLLGRKEANYLKPCRI